jgi:hypothetical protein
MALYDLEQLKKLKDFENQRLKLVPKIKNPSENALIKALFRAYDEKTTRSVNRKYERLCKEGFIDPLSPID